MGSLSVGLDGAQPDIAILILNLNWRHDRLSTILHGDFIDGSSILNAKSDISDSVSMLDKMLIHSLARVWLINRAQNKGGALLVPYHMLCDLSLTSLQPLVGQILEAKPASVEGGSLLGITHPEGYVIFVIQLLPKRRI